MVGSGGVRCVVVGVVVVVVSWLFVGRLSWMG